MRRATVYRHFPDERTLFLGCSGLSSERNPPPDPALWATIADPAERLEAALDPIYRWYAEIEPLLTAVLRDADAMPIIAELQAGRLAYLAAVEDGLAAGWGVRGRAARRLRGLARADAIAVMSSAVRAAAAADRERASR